MTKVTSYGKTPISVCHPDGSWFSGPVNTVYDNIEFNTGIVADYDLEANQATAFSNVPTARFVSIRTDAAISVKFNAATNHSITIAANTSFNSDTLEVTNIFITAVASANVKILLT